MALTIVQAKEFLKANVDEILANSNDSACKNIMSAVYYYNRAQNSYTEQLVIEATEAYIEKARKYKEGERDEV
jgi:hypothetical protein